MKPHRSNRNQGFLLLEVVLALAILGVGLTVIIELFSGGLRLARVERVGMTKRKPIITDSSKKCKNENLIYERRQTQQYYGVHG